MKLKQKEINTHTLIDIFFYCNMLTGVIRAVEKARDGEDFVVLNKVVEHLGFEFHHLLLLVEGELDHVAEELGALGGERNKTKGNIQRMIRFGFFFSKNI